MDETGREPTEPTEPTEGAPGERADRSEAQGQAREDQGSPREDQGSPREDQGSPREDQWRGGEGRRRRGRRGRGGRPGGPFLPGPREEEGSQQMRELAAWERRQRQTQRGPWRGPAFAGGPRPFGQQPFRGRPSGGPRQQRYQEMVRRATSGPRPAPPEEAGEPIAGPHAVLEALRAGRSLRRVYIAQERGVRAGPVADVIREAQERRIFIRYSDRIDLDRLSPSVEHQGVVAIAEGRAGVELDELLLHLDTLAEPPLVLVIDSLQDPQNFGVLLRSAEGAGVDGVVIPRHRQVGLTPAVSRTSAGAVEHLLIAEVANVRQAIDALKEKGIWVVAADGSGDLEWDEVDYREATAIVIGNEAEGIRRLVLEGCDQVVRIPMQGRVESLNAAAAGTAVLYEALRQRLRAGIGAAAAPRIERPVEELAGEDVEAEGAAVEAAVEGELVEEPRVDHSGAEEVAEAAEAPKPRKRTAAKKTAGRAARKKTE